MGGGKTERKMEEDEEELLWGGRRLKAREKIHRAARQLNV